MKLTGTAFYGVCRDKGIGQLKIIWFTSSFRIPLGQKGRGDWTVNNTGSEKFYIFLTFQPIILIYRRGYSIYYH